MMKYYARIPATPHQDWRMILPPIALPVGSFLRVKQEENGRVQIAIEKGNQSTLVCTFTREGFDV